MKKRFLPLLLAIASAALPGQAGACQPGWASLAQPDTPAVAVQSSETPGISPDPVPPRLVATVGAGHEVNGYTLMAGHGYFGAGYAGGSLVAQVAQLLSELGLSARSLPLVVFGAYGVSDRFTLGFGTGIWNYRLGERGLLSSEQGTDLFPYVAPKFRVLNTEPITASLGARAIVPISDGYDGVGWEVFTAVSGVARERVVGHASLGVAGDTEGDTYAVMMAAGTDFTVPVSAGNEFKLFAQLRLVREDSETVEIAEVGIRFLGETLGVEAGFHKWLEKDFKIRPMVSLAYRFR